MSLGQGTAALRVAVLGAGPVGLEAALYGAALGHQVLCIERGEVAAAVRSWGHVCMFSPWQMNISPLGAARLHGRGCAVPTSEPAAGPTGAEYAAHYLVPLSQDPLLAGRIRQYTRVVAVGKRGLRKGELIGQAARGEQPFRLLVEDAAGEHLEYADVVLDCSGTYGTPNAIGTGGIPAPGERWLGDRLIRHVPDVLGQDRGRFARRRVLLVGAGLSAATAAVALAELCQSEPATQVVWAVRRDLRPPYQPLADDALPGRARLLAAANQVAERAASGGRLAYRPATSVDSITAEGHRLRVRLQDDRGAATEELFDEVVGLTGYGPERDLYRELQVHECYASLGPMKLAATLLGQSGDCLAQPTPGPQTLHNPEPRFFILGAKSYGRNSAFLIQLGLLQIRAVFASLHGDPRLDLYAAPPAG
jgi:hypothetical protein